LLVSGKNKISSSISPFVKGGLRGISFSLYKREMQEGFQEISPNPSFIKRGVEWEMIKEGALKLDGISKMKIHYDKKLKKFSRTLRQEMTDAERLFWSKVRMKQLNGYQFYRQRPIDRYVVDFFCPKAKLIVEIDGGQHYEDDGRRKDEIRDKYLSGLGLKILRFSDRDIIENIEGVVEHVLENLE